MQLKNMKIDQKKAHEQYEPQQCETLENYPDVKGYDFEQEFDLKRFIKSYGHTGLQASNLAKAVQIVKSMRREKATIFFGCTSNIISSGLREIIKYLVKHKHIDVLVTSAGGIEEDIIKSLSSFKIGEFSAPGRVLLEKGINRIGNIFVPNDRYLFFERFMTNFLDDCYKEQKKGTIWNSRTLLKKAGEKLSENSILYWCAKNDIPVFCPALTDGAFGDMIFYAKQRHPDFILDTAQDIVDIVKISMNCDKSGLLILGGGVSKHFILNSQIFREGADYAVYINTAQEFDGCDSGARIDEAVSWGKIKPSAPNTKIHADASLVFPLLVASTFAGQ